MKRLIAVLSILIGASMLLGACAPAAAPAPTAVPAAATQAPVATTAPVAVAATATEAPVTPGGTLPRNETLYFNGQQWGSVVCWNPYSSNCNNAMAIAPGDNSRVTMFETPYLYDMMDGKQYPLLADGPWAWNAANTAITFKIKKAAHWSDGTPVTADDVAYTWASYVKYKANAGVNFGPYIDSIVAVDSPDGSGQC